jgi:hypothetical protein
LVLLALSSRLKVLQWRARMLALDTNSTRAAAAFCISHLFKEALTGSLTHLRTLVSAENIPAPYQALCAFQSVRSNYPCFACHHDLTPDVDAIEMSTGRPRVNASATAMPKFSECNGKANASAKLRKPHFRSNRSCQQLPGF